ncbi:14-3-3 protein [Trichoderma citrinoviride]|uniref:14-3-3 protein n=1 Tax=Trichoderma citrinoviride TaxID=58853 RepID=A0A2T4B0A5_9HYPO|nr:14-3-3 protein [Trichoderma citrinoviride]PTB62752.1 14-3-3 protein [Trichoderma citrinoviride]
MASSEVDQKYLGRMARSVEGDNAILSSTLFKILGLSLRLSDKLVEVKKQRKPDATLHENIMRILWLAREGLKMLQEYVIPFVTNCVELKVLAYKLRASFYHIFVLFRNQPRVSNMPGWDPDAVPADGGKDMYGADDYQHLMHHSLEGGPVGPPPGFEAPVSAHSLSFLLPAKDYLPTAHQYFEEAAQLADALLWGSHSLRLSVKTEYAAFLYECVHDADASRTLARNTINEVYEATEGMDDDMFRDACELVTVLGKMMRRGLGSNNTLHSKAQVSHSASSPGATPPVGMENPI